MASTDIPLARPWFDEREVEAVARVLERGWVVQGAEVAAFEKDVAALHSAEHAVAVSSGTAALHVAFLALGLGAGDAVFIPSFAWPSAANMAVSVGARPVFVDVLEDTYNLDPDDLHRCIQQCLQANWGKPTAVVAVHEFGLAADMDRISKIAADHGMLVVEDAACALGAKYKGKPVGTLGRLGIFSFHPRKAVTTGEGGIILARDGDLAEACSTWRNHGQTSGSGSREFVVAGMNYRLTEIQAAIGRVQLQRFPAILETRRTIAGRYLDALAGCPGLRLPAPDAEHTWQTFMVQLDDRIDRDGVIQALAEHGIGAGLGSVSGHCTQTYRDRYHYREEDLPVSRRLYRSGLALPLHPRLTEADQARVVRALVEILGEG